MAEQIDYNALLLKVMAHDLLSPLTAIKWQTELLESCIKDKKKRDKYLNGIAESVKLGIALTMHSHIAANVLTDSYEGEIEQIKLSEAVKQSVHELHSQYDRHGLILDIDIDEGDDETNLDVLLVRLFIWSVAKFFLTCVPAHTTVKMTGRNQIVDSENNYIFTVSAPNVLEPEKCIQAISQDEAQGEYDQMFVFAKLIKEVAPLIDVSVSAKANEGVLIIESTF